MEKRIKTLLKAIVSVALVVYLTTLIDWDSISKLDYKSLIVILGGIIITLMLLTVMALRWKYLVSLKADNNFSIKTAIRGYLGGSFFSIVLPGAIGGDIYRIKYCSDLTFIKLRNAGIIILIERLFGVIAIGVIFCTGLFIVGLDAIAEYMPSSEIIKLLITFAIIGLIAGVLFLKYKYGLSISGVIKVLLLSFSAQGLDIFIGGAVLAVVSPGSNPFWMLIAAPLAYVITVLPISLGGLGVREGVLVAVLSLFGVETAQSVIISLMIYLIKVLTGVIGGTYVFWVHPEKDKSLSKMVKELKKSNSI